MFTTYGDDDGVWQEELEATEWDGEQWDDPLAALRLPERADLLDFSGVLPTVSSPPARMGESYSPKPDTHVGRMARASVRLKEVGAMRPAVRIPGKPAKRDAEQGGAARRQAKLPPVWLLANVVILVVAGIAVLPRVISVDAASACKWHRVVPGDTLGNIGWANHTNALALARANSIKNPDLIYVGQMICIPLSGGAHANVKPPAVTHPPSYGTARNEQAFVNYALPYARQAHQQTGWPVSMILAQWGLEHGWRIPGFTGYNWGNSGAVPGFPRVAGTNVPGSPAAFAYARTPDDGVRIYVHCAHLSYYTWVARAAASGGPNAAARALGRSPWDAGHYTAVGSPGSSLVNIMRVYNLYWYDTH